MEAQEVQVAVRVSGDYAAWHELSITLMYDYTNDKRINDSKEEADEALEEGHDGEYSDCQMMDAIFLNGVYYVKASGGFL